MAEIYELDSPEYEKYEVDWLQNDGRGNLNTDFVKWFNNEKDLLNLFKCIKFNKFKRFIR